MCPVLTALLNLLLTRSGLRYCEDGHVPHIHVEFGEFSVVLAIADGEVLAGEIPKSKLKLALAWVEIHRDDLMADWKLAVEGREVFKIDPLK